MKVFIFVLAVVASAAAAPSSSYDYKPSYKQHYDYVRPVCYLQFKGHWVKSIWPLVMLLVGLQAPAYYNFDYGVKDDYTYVDMGHNEHRDGDHTKGEYFVVLPDGRRQVVSYYVDGYSGYVADVKYDGHAKYDQSYKPAYKADYEPVYKPAYQPSYQSSYKPSYKPSYQSNHKPVYTPVYTPVHKTKY